MSVIDRSVRSLASSAVPEADTEAQSATRATAARAEPGRSSGRWRHRLCRTVLIASGLLLETVSVLAGGLIAECVAPGLLLPSPALYGFALAYLPLAAIATLARELSSKRGGARWFLWPALLLGLIATRSHQADDTGRFAIWFLVSGGCIALVRTGVEWLDGHALARFLPCRTVAFLGNSESAARMLAQLRSAARPVRTVGYFDDRLTRPGPLTDLLPCLGTIDDLVGFMHDNEIAEVYMALPWSAGPRISELIERLRFLPLTVRLVPDHVPPALPGRGDGQVQGVVMPTLMVPPFSAAGAVFKRGLDLVLGGSLLVSMLPLFAAVALCIRLDSRGPVFFRQVRSGQYGRPFRIFKFRTLHIEQADAIAETLVTSGDRRVTRVGRVLRKYSIDELPQLFNVVLGHMSLVGPRPHAPKAKADGRIYAELIPEYMLRYRVKPGMTGWAQVNGWRGNTDTEEQLRKRVEFDFQYIGAWSPLKDVEIMVRTVPAMLLPPPQNV